MLSFRSIYLVAAAAFVVFTSAFPIQEMSVDVGTRPFDTDGRPVALLDERAAANLGGGVTADGDADVVGAEIHRYDIGHRAEARETLQSLSDIFSSAKNQLTGVEVQAKSLSDGGKSVDVGAIQPCLDQVNGILTVVLANIKLLKGKPLSVILGGCTMSEIANLLCTVLTLVVNILGLLIGCAGPNSDTIIDIIVKTISVVLCEVLTLVLGLVGGLLVLLLPLLTGILSLLTGCGLGGVLGVLGL